MRLTAIAVMALGGLALAQALTPDPARRSAQAIDLLRLGQETEVWPLLRASDDNTVRSYLVRDFARLDVNPDILIRRLRTEPDVSTRRALLLALGGYEPALVRRAGRDALITLLRAWYERDPDAGIHSAVQWLVKNRGVGSFSPAAAVPPAGAGWSVTVEGQTMAAFHGPLTVGMGSPDDEVGRQPASDSPPEPRHAVTVRRSFAIGTTEVTNAEFRRFLDANPDVRRGYQYPDAPSRMADVLARFSPTGDSPAIAMTWYEAAMYCNWLSAREGLAESEWVYPAGLLASGMRLPSDYLHRRGYRLPTEAEWELASRAGSVTPRHFGTALDLLGEYAWFARNPPRRKNDPVDPSDPQRTAPVGTLRPNDAGLFDMYGNVWEWTQDRVERHSGERHQDGRVDDDQDEDREDEDREDTALLVRDGDARTRRGGAFPYPAAMARSAARGTVSSLPTTRRDNVGFRVARTIR
jgi:formylglycine-generating enzyme required for sulfatase activity